MKNERSAQGSNVPATVNGPAPAAMGEFTPAGLVDFPSTPTGIVDSQTKVTRSGPGTRATLGAYKS